MKPLPWLVLLTLGFCMPVFVSAQIPTAWVSGSDMNGLPAAALFLTIAPDARAAGMGDAGTASDPDLNSQHWNPSKYAFINGKGGVAATYTPWLTHLLPNIDLGYLAGYYRLNEKNTLSASFRYFSLGRYSRTFFSGIADSDYLFELAGDLAYVRKFTDHLSGGITARYIQSDLVPSWVPSNGWNAKPGRSVAGDLGLYYQHSFGLGSRTARWALGGLLSNLGTPISYHGDSEQKTPIPTNLRLGTKLSLEFNERRSLTLLADLNKLLVPTPAVYDQDTVTGNLLLVRGMDPPESTFQGMIQSFYDAPGILTEQGDYSVFREELREIVYNLGVEFRIDEQLALRSGYFHEHSTKGNRQYFTIGFGTGFRFLSLDLSCLLPVTWQNSVLYRTFRFSLTANFGA